MNCDNFIELKFLNAPKLKNTLRKKCPNTPNIYTTNLIRYMTSFDQGNIQVRQLNVYLKFFHNANVLFIISYAITILICNLNYCNPNMVFIQKGSSVKDL